MNHQQYMNDLRRSPPYHPGYDVIARAYKNAKGIDELIHLHRTSWQYVDWLEANDHISFADWVIHCDNHPSPGFTLSHLLQYWLYEDECYRWESGEVIEGRVRPSD